MPAEISLSMGEIRKLALPFAAMVLVFLAANVAVQHPFDFLGLAQWVTWGTLVYPLTFLINDLTNRFYGTHLTTKLIVASFPAGIAIGVFFIDLRIALASGIAFLISQQLDNKVFDRLRDRLWWQGPLISSSLASIIDTWFFYAAAFAGTTDNGVYFGVAAPLWAGWASGDLIFKFAVAGLLLIPYRFAQLAWQSRQNAAAL